ncbi:MAG: hypothetical protein GY755_10755 [Chloroflexi bacterium]|nr:hypothetical protein [Chloroflexota bacterium]
MPNYKGEWALSEKQVDGLQAHHMNLTTQMLQWLDSKFRLRPRDNANWLMLGQHLIELLQLSDAPAFQLTCQGHYSVYDIFLPRNQSFFGCVYC